MKRETFLRLSALDNLRGGGAMPAKLVQLLLLVISMGAAHPCLSSNAGHKRADPIVAKSDRKVSLCSEAADAQISVDTGHPWRPPFGIDRVGAPPVVNVALKAAGPLHGEYHIISYDGGSMRARVPLSFRRDGKLDLEKLLKLSREGSSSSIKKVVDTGPYFANVQLDSVPAEVALEVRCAPGEPRELIRQSVAWPALQADAVARPVQQINPVDLGAILVPHDRLLLASGQSAIVEVAAIAYAKDFPYARLEAQFTGCQPLQVAFPLLRKRRTTIQLHLPIICMESSEALQIRLLDGGRELWKRRIRTMVVEEQPQRPSFGAVETKLRYDAPISVKDTKTGAYSSMDYQTAWNEKLRDIVVFLPNGSRFVFWRGSSYVPFWAGRYNTGTNNQWAESGSEKDAVDAVEPLQDKELRYSRVQIIESTPSRVHVRWTYQSTDLVYRVWGDQATEDFYFYPDGFGTRVLTLTSEPNRRYQVAEFIIIAPAAAYPLEILPNRIIDMIYLDGEKKSLVFPNPLPLAKSRGSAITEYLMRQWINPPQKAAVYRVFDHKDDPTSAICFSPLDVPRVLSVFKPFYDRGNLVSPAYWGDHWPLGRGAMTGGAISDRIDSSPSHISLMGGTADDEGKPLSTNEAWTLDTLGRSRVMQTRRWAWLIARTDIPDNQLVDWGRSYSSPPSLELSGARVGLPSYSPDRRALRLIVDAPTVRLRLIPVRHTMNPVFELEQAPGGEISVALDGKVLPPDRYAWDGRTLWVEASIGPKGADIELSFNFNKAQVKCVLLNVSHNLPVGDDPRCRRPS